MDSDDLAFAGATEQARMLAEGTITAPALLEIYLDRIARLDPQLRSYRVVLAGTARPEALDGALWKAPSGESAPPSPTLPPSTGGRARARPIHMR